MEEGWISSDKVKNKYREVRGTYMYDATKKTYNLMPHAEVNYYEILLTQERTTFISKKHFERLKQHRWNAVKDKNMFYACTNIDGNNVTMHRLLTNFEYEKVDHINHDGLFNIDENLRDGSHGINERNQKEPVSAYYVKGRDCYVGQFYAYNGLRKAKYFYLYNYDTEKDAKSAAREWARLNNQLVIEQIERDGPCCVEHCHIRVPLTSSTGHKNITYCKDRNGYMVRMYRDGKKTSKWFPYVSQNKESVLDEAITFRDDFIAANPLKKKELKKQKIE